MSVLKIKKLPLALFLRDLDNRVPLAFSRWGDGEWRSVLGRAQGVNCDQHWYYPEMGRELAAVLESRPPYMLGMQMFALRLQPVGGQIIRWLEARKIDREWIDADVFHRASQEGSLTRLMSILRTKPTLLIGPPHLRGFASTHLMSDYIEAPPQNAYLANDRLVEQARKWLDSQDECGVVGLSIGMSAGLVIHRLWPDYGPVHTLIDFGSVWDPWCGVSSRKYMAGLPHLPEVARSLPA